MGGENRMRPRGSHMFGAVALLCVASVIFDVVRAPSTQEAMRRSLKELNLLELATAFAASSRHLLD